MTSPRLGLSLAGMALASLPFAFTLEPDRKVHVVGTAHLDTQWLWTIQETIDKHIPKTIQLNLEAFENYPDYKFSFEGSFRYQLMKEYYPEQFSKVKKAIADGKWVVNGSWVDAVDTNVPSPESLMRHALYGNGYFRREFGKSSVDVFLPDCFGFSYTLPTIAAHTGLKGFSTQKLGWGSSVGTPFKIGQWQGVDGSRIIAALDPGAYVGNAGNDWDRAQWLLDHIDQTGKASGNYVAYRYHGDGDTGGGPKRRSLENLLASQKGGGPIKVVSAGADQLFREFPAAQAAKLPLYNGELLMTAHGTGCYTAQTAMKAWNKKNELLADAAERAAVAARVLVGEPYPRKTLEQAWVRFLWHQFHDDLTGTSIPEAYKFSWNDELISLNQFADVLQRSVSSWSSRMDTSGPGLPIVVYNPTALPQRSLVEAWVPAKSGWVAFGPQGEREPVQVLESRGDQVRVAFSAQAPGVGLSVYRLLSQQKPPASQSLKATDRTLENNRLKVTIDANGDVASVFDKKTRRETLKAPIRLQMLDNVSQHWSAWEVLYDTVAKGPRSFVGANVAPKLIENGPVCATIESSGTTDGSKFVRRVSLKPGDSDIVEFEVDVDWRTKGTLLKAAFSIDAPNPKAVYDLGLGSIERGVNTRKLYEVPAQEWADLSSGDGKFGAAILTHSKYGWDRPEAGTIRLTLIHTADGKGNWDFQDSNDLGSHSIRFALKPHSGDWRNGVGDDAQKYNQPLVAFHTSSHKGDLGKSYGFLKGSLGGASVEALKLADNGDDIVLRLFEGRGKPGRATVALGVPIRGMKSLYGDEMPNAPKLSGDSVAKASATIGLKPFGPRTVGLSVPMPKEKLEQVAQTELPFTQDVTREGIDATGRTIPLSLWPNRVATGGLQLKIARGLSANALVCGGQKIPLSAGKGNRLTILAAAKGTHVPAAFEIDGVSKQVKVPASTGWVGQWWDRLVSGKFDADPAKLGKPYSERTPIAYLATHLDKPDGKFDAYRFGQIYRLDLPITPGAKSVTLPVDNRVLVFAMGVWNDEAQLRPTMPLYE